MNKVAEGGKIVSIEESKKEQLLEQMQNDSYFLREHTLIDYSVFLI